MPNPNHAEGQSNLGWLSKMFEEDVSEKTPDRISLDVLLKVVESLIVAQPAEQQNLLRGILGEMFRNQVSQQDQISKLSQRVKYLEEKRK